MLGWRKNICLSYFPKYFLLRIICIYDIENKDWILEILLKIILSFYIELNAFINLRDFCLDVFI